jgi:HK97 family phage prohead protease
VSEYRQLGFEAELSLRADDPDGDGRTVIGRAVPYDVIVSTPDVGDEAFVQGAFARTITHGKLSRVKLCVSHRRGEPVGVCTRLDERADGLYGEWRVSRTSAGDDVLEQVRDSTLDELSIGFMPEAGHRDRGAYVHTQVRLAEVSLVPWGVYGDAGAKVLAVRSLEPAGTPRLDSVAEILAKVAAHPVA